MTEVACPRCKATQTVSPDEYDVFELTCENCQARAMGEYNPGTESVAWRWHKPSSDAE